MSSNPKQPRPFPSPQLHKTRARRIQVTQVPASQQLAALNKSANSTDPPAHSSVPRRSITAAQPCKTLYLLLAAQVTPRQPPQPPNQEPLLALSRPHCPPPKEGHPLSSPLLITSLFAQPNLSSTSTPLLAYNSRPSQDSHKSPQPINTNLLLQANRSFKTNKIANAQSRTKTMAENDNQSPQDNVPPPNTEHLNIKVTDNNNEVFFKIKRSTKLEKLMTAFCERQGKSLNSVRFLFDGTRVQPTDTPDAVCSPLLHLSLHFPSICSLRVFLKRVSRVLLRVWVSVADVSRVCCDDSSKWQMATPSRSIKNKSAGAC